jgi:hypothetical protein
VFFVFVVWGALVGGGLVVAEEEEEEEEEEEGVEKMEDGEEEMEDGGGWRCSQVDEMQFLVPFGVREMENTNKN